jgi:hypothetical protein
VSAAADIRVVAGRLAHEDGRAFFPHGAPLLFSVSMLRIEAEIGCLRWCKEREDEPVDLISSGLFARAALITHAVVSL